MRQHVVVVVVLVLGSMQSALTQIATAEDEVTGETAWFPQQPEPQDDTYWSGTAPLCLGGCRGRHRELKTDPCGDSSCCWVGSKPDVDYNGVAYGTDWWVGSVVRYECRSGFLLVGEPTRVCQSSGLWTTKPTCLRCGHLDRCRNKETGWKRFFSPCVPCLCDCLIPCGGSVSS
ncbi:hypothetical protein CRUP_005522 [Coryphaenoides rupestris]|nr:hypothetical protein CRUP_005522 [Coryphaenoides rupestris]